MSYTLFIIQPMERNWHHRKSFMGKRVIFKWLKVCRTLKRVFRRAQAKKWVRETLKLKWNDLKWKRKRPKHWLLLWACSYCAGCHSLPCTWYVLSARIVYHRYCSPLCSGWVTAIQRSIRWSMHCSRKTFASLSSESFVNVSVPDRDFIKRPAEGDRICHSYALVVERQAYHPVQQPIRWAMKVIMRPNRRSLGDGHCAPALVQLVVLGADNTRTVDRYTKYAIHWLWKVRLSRMVDVDRNRIRKGKCKFFGINSLICWSN